MSGKYEENLGIIVMNNCKEFGDAINKRIMEKRGTDKSFIIPVDLVRFNNGEGKAVIMDTVRDKDLYIRLTAPDSGAFLCGQISQSRARNCDNREPQSEEI